MNCTIVIERLGEVIDRVLPQAEAAEVEAHLASCAACRAELEELRRALDAVKALPRIRAPRGFAAGVMAEIRAGVEAPVSVPATPSASAISSGRTSGRYSWSTGSSARAADAQVAAITQSHEAARVAAFGTTRAA